MALNNTSAIIGAKPLEGSVVDDLRNQELMDMQNREQNREDMRIRLAQKEKQDAKNEAYDKKIADVASKDVPITGYSSVDEGVIDYIQGQGGLLDQYYETMEQLRVQPNGKDRAKLLAKSNNLEKNIDTIKQLQEGLVARTAELQKGLDSGELSPELNKQRKDELNSIIKDYKFKLLNDENGVLRVRYGNENQVYDPDGDGVANEFTLSELLDGRKLGNFKPKFQPTKWLADAKPRYGTKETVTDGNYTKTTIKGFNPDLQGELNKEVDTLFGESVAGMSDNAKSYLADIKNIDYKSMDEKQFSEFKEEYKNQFKAQYDATDKKERDYGAMNASQRLAYDKSKDAEKKKVEYEVVTTPPVYEKAGVKPAQGYKTVSVSNAKPIPYLQGFVGKDKRTITNGSIASYTVEKDKAGNRVVVAEIVYQDSKSSTLSKEDQMILQDNTVPQETKDLILSKVNKGAENKSVIMRLTEKDGVKYAKDLGFDDYNEMKRTARTGEETPKETASERALRIANGG